MVCIISPALLLWSILRMLLKAFVHPSLFVPAEFRMLNSGNVFLITSGGHAATDLASAHITSTPPQKNEGSSQDSLCDAGLHLVKKANISFQKARLL